MSESGAGSIECRENNTRRRKFWLKVGGFGVGAVSLLLLAGVLLYRGRSSAQMPKEDNPVTLFPQMPKEDNLVTLIPVDCTKLELEYYPSVAEYHDQWFDMNPNLFNSAELERLHSRGSFVLDIQLTIRFFSKMLRSHPFSEGSGGAGGDKYIKVHCYRNDEQVETLTVYEPDLIVTQDGRRFQNKDVRGGLPIEEVSSLWLRQACAMNLSTLYRFKFGGIGRQYPSPSEWCDEVSKPDHRESVRWRERVNSPSPVLRNLACPGAGEGRCHYAMNPDCKPDSPPNTVLLFETTGGWNKHGGPELFTFDNHVPPGGCVLLKDGTVKFIRTQEELKQLRWQQTPEQQASISMGDKSPILLTTRFSLASQPASPIIVISETRVTNARCMRVEPLLG